MHCPNCHNEMKQKYHDRQEHKKGFDLTEIYHCENCNAFLFLNCEFEMNR